MQICLIAVKTKQGLNRLNSDITEVEIQTALKLAKAGKAAGINGLPVEVLRNPACARFMTLLFNICFRSGQMGKRDYFTNTKGQVH